jgi:hypothetical protein
MANAKSTAPLLNLPEEKGNAQTKYKLEQEYKNFEFDPSKRYMFKLVSTVPEGTRPVVDQRTGRPIPKKEFRPFQNLVLTSQIVWEGKRVNIRYYDGCDSIFVSEQPKEKELIDQLIAQTKKRNFLNGKLVVEGYDQMLLFYLTVCSWNVDSPFRTNTANGIFKSENTEKRITEESKKVDMIEEALELAKKASKTKMLIHAAYLGIPTIDYDTSNELTEAEIRAKYRKAALSDAEGFMSSYGNTALETKYYIEKALNMGLISNKNNPNKAEWSKSGNVICDISGLRSPEAIANRLFEFASTEEGEEFKIQVAAIFN